MNLYSHTLTLTKPRHDESCNILIVDDHAIFRQGLRKLFDERAEFTVVGEAATGAEALAAVRQISS